MLPVNLRQPGGAHDQSEHFLSPVSKLQRSREYDIPAGESKIFMCLKISMSASSAGLSGQELTLCRSGFSRDDLVIVDLANRE
jgi:hypothetical protein